MSNCCTQIYRHGPTGTVNPYCQLELENQFFRTHTELKNKNPNWDRQFNFSVTDAFSVLKISVFRKENSEKVVNLKYQLLGKDKWGFKIREQM